MNKTILTKIILILIIILTIIPTNNVFADQSTFSIDGFMGEADKFIEGGKKEGEDLIGKDGIKSISDVMYNTLLAIGLVVAVAVGIFLGIKIMASSIEEQAKYKQMLTPYFIGCVVVFGAFGIWKVVVNILQKSI